MDGVQDAQHAQGVHIAGVLGGVEADPHVALGGQVVDLVGADLAHDLDDGGRVGQIAVMQGDGMFGQQMVDTAGVGDGGAADNAVDLVALFQQELGQIAAVLARDTGDQCFLHIAQTPYQIWILERPSG